MSSTSSSESSSESGAILIASILTSIKRIPSLRKLIRIFSCDQSTGGSSSGSISGNKIKQNSSNGCNGYNNKITPGDCNCKSIQVNKATINNSIGCEEIICTGSHLQLDPPVELVKVTDVPSYLQFNPFILTGYRQPCMTSYDCLKSLLYFHNETINIMTHGECEFRKNETVTSKFVVNQLSLSQPVISLFLFALVMPKFMPWDEISHPMLAYSCVLGSVSSWVGSSIYHLFMNHEKGEPLYHQLLQFDVIGIWITQAIGASTTLYVSVVSYNIWIQITFLLFYAVFSIKSLNDVVMATSAPARVLGFASLVLMRIIAFALRIFSIPSGAASVS